MIINASLGVCYLKAPAVMILDTGRLKIMILWIHLFPSQRASFGQKLTLMNGTKIQDHQGLPPIQMENHISSHVAKVRNLTILACSNLGKGTFSEKFVSSLCLRRSISFSSFHTSSKSNSSSITFIRVFKHLFPILRRGHSLRRHSLALAGLKQSRLIS